MRRFCSFEADVFWIRSGLQYSGVQWSKLPKFILSSDLFKFHTGLRNFIALMAFLSRKHRFLTAKSSCAVPELLMALGHCVKKAQEGPIGKKKTWPKRRDRKTRYQKKTSFIWCVFEILRCTIPVLGNSWRHFACRWECVFGNPCLTLDANLFVQYKKVCMLKLGCFTSMLSLAPKFSAKFPVSSYWGASMFE